MVIGNKHNNNIIIVVGLISSLLLFNFNSYSQNEKSNYLSFSFTNTNYTPIKIKNYGLDILYSNISPSYDIGMDYSRFIKKGWGIGTGVHFSDISYNLNANFYIESDILHPIDGPLYHKEKNRNTSYRFSFPIYAFKEIKVNHDLNIKISTGISIDYLAFLPFIYETNIYIADDNFQNPQNLYYGFLENQYNYPFISYFAKVGIVKYFKKNHYLNINFVACHSPMKIGIGNYEFYNLKNESKGFLEWRASYFGIELNYGLNLKTKKKRDKEN